MEAKCIEEAFEAIATEERITKLSDRYHKSWIEADKVLVDTKRKLEKTELELKKLQSSLIQDI